MTYSKDTKQWLFDIWHTKKRSIEQIKQEWKQARELELMYDPDSKCEFVDSQYKALIEKRSNEIQEHRDRLSATHNILTRNGLKQCYLCRIWKPLNHFEPTLNKYTLKNPNNKGKQYTCIACNEKQKLRNSEFPNN